MSVKTFLVGCALLAYCKSYVSADNSTIHFNSFAPRSNKCPAGEFGTSTTDCTPCPVGSYSDSMPFPPRTLNQFLTHLFLTEQGSASCTPASPGFYVSVSGSSSQTPCTPGFYNNQPGLTACSPCMPGSYSSSTSCRLHYLAPTHISQHLATKSAARLL